MQLSEELASLFVKVTKDEVDTNKETTVYGELVKVGDAKYVRIDGSDLLTPVTSTVAANDGERVVVTIKNHTATVTGNSSSPAARSGDVEDVSNRILQIDNTITQIDNQINQQDNTITQLHNSIEQQGNTIIQIGNSVTQIGNKVLQQDNTISQQGNTISQINNDIVQQNTTISQMNTAIQQQDSTIKNVSSELTTVKSDVTVNKSSVQILNSAFVIENGVLKGLDGIVVEDLKTNHLDAKYADIDFANIGEVAVGKIFADSGIIKDLVVEEGHITGELVGVTIKGDLIEGNTIVAEKLVVKGNNGLYYKLNTDGMSVEAEQTEYNSLNGSIIAAKSITATKIDVSDLVAFNATIGGFHIGNHSLYSGVKQSADNTTRGIYMDDQGQFALGDSSNYLKYYKDTDGSYKLDVSAKSIKFGTSGESIETAIGNVSDSSISKVQVEYALGDSSSLAPTSGWSENAPLWIDGKYMWQRTVTQFASGRIVTSDAVCISGAKGDNGEKGEIGQGVVLIEPQYYLSMSKTSQTGGTWESSSPEWHSDTYLWTRSKVTYSNPTSVAYTTPVLDSTWEAVSNVEIGGRNLIIGKDVSHKYYIGTDGTPVSSNASLITDFIPITPGQNLILQYWTTNAHNYVNNDRVWHSGIAFYKEDYSYLSGRVGQYISDDHFVYIGVAPENASYVRMSYYFPNFEGRDDAIESWTASDNNFRWKLEVGTKPTDWTMAPEDSATNESVASAVETAFKELEDRISMLVRGKDGSSLMQQTDDGWIFAMGDTLSDLESAVDGINELSSNMGDLENRVNDNSQVISSLQEVTDSLHELTAYIRMFTENDKPVLELGNSTRFRTRITNYAMQFMDGNDVPAYISNKALMIDKAEVENELVFGGFAFIKRANGNMGLTWRGG